MHCLFLLQENRFGKCDTCSAIKAERKKADTAEKKALLKERDEQHRKFFMYVSKLITLITFVSSYNEP